MKEKNRNLLIGFLIWALVLGGVLKLVQVLWNMVLPEIGIAEVSFVKVLAMYLIVQILKTNWLLELKNSAERFNTSIQRRKEARG